MKKTQKKTTLLACCCCFFVFLWVAPSFTSIPIHHLESTFPQGNVVAKCCRAHICHGAQLSHCSIQSKSTSKTVPCQSVHAWCRPTALSTALASSEQRAVGSLAMIDGIQAVHCDPAKAHTEANTLTQNCSGGPYTGV